jgi:hypothetical protein
LTHTFDIRFARSAGFGAWLEEPGNRFRWKGAGRLSISRDGITIAAKRSLASLFRGAAPRRIPAENLKEVYREGAALRFEFSTTDNPREVVPLWVRDRETAANIVQLLPTTRTVELEETSTRAAPRARVDARVVIALLSGVAIGAAIAYVSMRGNSVAPVIAVETPAPPVIGTSVDTASPIATIEARSVDARARDLRGSPGYLLAAPIIVEFNSRAEGLLHDYRLRREDLESDVLSREQYADALSALQLEWWDATTPLLEAHALEHPDVVAIRATMLETSRHWRDFLIVYGEGMRRDDPNRIARSWGILWMAERAQWKMRDYAP